MDIVLEICDTLFFDQIYAHFLPASHIHYARDGFANTTSHTIIKAASALPWQFTPSSSLIYLTPGDSAYMSRWTRDKIYRQAISLFLITWLAGAAIYFIFSTFSYIFVFDKKTTQHPKFLKNQIRMEINQAIKSMPFISILTTPFFLAEVRGHSKLYDALSDQPFIGYNILQFPLFLIFTDFCIYWIHRGLHHPLIYKTLHKPHHKWIMPSPYASVAFHPLDGWAQSVPYHLFPFIFPLQKFVYLALFFFVQIWTIMIHDGEYVANSPIINGAACHTMHHLYFNYNYGQYTTLWDRMGGSYRKPNQDLFKPEAKMSKKEWDNQVKEMERMVVEVEGEDNRKYLTNEKKEL
ncbi:putative Delta-desaturase [Golovinomyces cichoracearum]|uniref:Putative Delta-desaturase n=1 Tax=Golovinomyces cichoracearum TaxID=62708 RepID=A0A420IRG6_9PEZI|nr:putative Delta-desaturase [Golovinomyces cichoracearum]